jgi:hypothetical protein
MAINHVRYAKAEACTANELSAGDGCGSMSRRLIELFLDPGIPGSTEGGGFECRARALMAN